MTTPFLLSVHHASKSWRDRPLCIIPGLAMITQGPMSSKCSTLYTEQYFTTRWWRPWNRPLSSECVWRWKDLKWQSVFEYAHSWLQWKSDKLLWEPRTHDKFERCGQKFKRPACHALLGQWRGIVYWYVMELRMGCPVLIWWVEGVE